ncbi:MAG: PAS domain-containing sensor histidine kinase [Acidobacteria bacterium]|nr:MAG: PAS domain-containing sensor histidine kinase [Acidobacteriota bacterium]
MIPSSLILEILVALVMGLIVAYSFYIARRENLVQERGFRLILAGFCLLLVGALVDISDHFPSLSRFYVLGRTPLQSLVEKVVGFLSGFLLLAIGLRRWLPHIAAQRRAEARRLAHSQRQQEETAAALKRSEALLETVVASSPIILLAADREGRITLARGSALRALTRRPRSLRGRSLCQLLTLPQESFRRVLEGAQVMSTFDHDGRTWRLRASPWHDDDGTVVGVIALALDITELQAAEIELRRAKERAEEASHAKSRFLATMSHELRTPLNSVIGFAAVLRRNKGGNLTASDLDYLARIYKNGQHLLQLIDEILDLTKIEAGRLEVKRCSFDLRQLVADTVGELRHQAPPAVAVETRLPQAPVILDSDPTKLKQVLINLLANAFKFTEEGSVTVAVETDRRGRPLAVTVSDTGIGIPRDRLGTIFQAFQQVDAGIGRRYGGTGLGLAISRSLCRLLGFEVEVESTVGRGSTFRIVLAPAERRAGRPAAPPLAAADRRRRAS